MKLPDLSFEKEIFKTQEIIIAIDEAGRGAIAGPLTVSSIAFQINFLKQEKSFQKLKVNDSKKLSETHRESLRDKLEGQFKKYLLHLSNKTIDKIGIQKTFYKALSKIESFWSQTFPNRKIALLIDYFAYKPNSKNVTSFSVKKGDERCFSIAIASIFAKTERDRFLRRLHLKYPSYNFKKNKGYGTKEHLEKILYFGPCQYHRKTFLKKILLKKNNLTVKM